MADWLVEHGIGEDRAVLCDHGRILESRVYRRGMLGPGHVSDARLVSRAKGSKRGTVQFASGEEALVSGLAVSASEGSTIRCKIVRSQVPEKNRRKLACAVPTGDAPTAADTLFDQLTAQGLEPKLVRRFPDCDWDELWLEAWNGAVSFDGGELIFADTPAMMLIDIDGGSNGGPDARLLALSAVTPIAESIGRFDLSGSIGIDFPTLQAKTDRKAVDQAIGAALDHWPHERTAMNGFGFVQIAARFERPSLIQHIQHARAASAACLLLRKAEHVSEPGALQINCHPAVAGKLQDAWLAELSRRTGREVRTAVDPSLALEAGFAQAVPL